MSSERLEGNKPIIITVTLDVTWGKKTKIVLMKKLSVLISNS